ncbi:hypothetical protein SY2F82_11900 [Streptomyces sp. Y2F8-2]|nr:hypothetical protein SY2F82_11900 [Streptomyces sp. Y2F8-2]
MTDHIASDVRVRAVPPAGGRRSRAGFWLVAAVYAVVMLGGTLPIPLYVLWAPQMGFGPSPPRWSSPSAPWGPRSR